MIAKLSLISAAALLAGSSALAASGPTDPQIAHIAYTAGNIDVDAAKQALQKSQNKAVREFAEEMVRDHDAVNQKFGLIAPDVCGDVPAKSTTTESPSTVSATSIRTGISPMPSSSIQSAKWTCPRGSAAMAARVSRSV